jgi:predicted dithiol-disulfide oxidoreductase (DUF899 family)
MPAAYPGESSQYRTARDRLLEQEIELRRAMEAVAVARRALPLGGEVPEDYVFTGVAADGGSTEIRFSELFRPGRDTLVIYNMMFPRSPTENLPCPTCTAFMDSFDGVARHAEQQLNLAVVAKTDLANLVAHAAARGWQHLQLLSSGKSNFNRDYYGESEDEQIPMLNVFRRSGGRFYHTWGSELIFAPTDGDQDPRHTDTIDPLWNLFDFTPDGRGTFYPSLQY